MSFYEDQEADWFAHGCQGEPSDYDGCGEIAPWADKKHFNPGMSVIVPVSKYPSKSARRNAQRKRSRARKLQAKKEERQ